MKEKKIQDNSMFAEERRYNILSEIRDKGRIFVKDLSKEFKVSEVTIRQDLSKMEENNLLIRTYGGAILKTSLSEDFPLSERITKQLPQKEAIAREAIKFISNNDSIIFDGGSTILELGRLLAMENQPCIKAVVNFLPLITLFQNVPSIDMMILGGTYDDKLKSMIGPITSENLQSIYVDKAFISTTAISLENGLGCTSILEAALRKVMLTRANQKILLADSSKIHRCCFTNAGDLTQIDILITDWNISSKDYDTLSDMGINVIIAPSMS